MRTKVGAAEPPSRRWDMQNASVTSNASHYVWRPIPGGDARDFNVFDRIRLRVSSWMRWLADKIEP